MSTNHPKTEQARREVLTAHERARAAVKEHNHVMRGYTTKLIPHPTVAKTWVEVRTPIAPKKKPKL